jgi:putative sigma-54 modulation protein
LGERDVNDDERISMQIEVKGRNTQVSDELREYVERRFTKVAKQVSELARLEVELKEERNPAIADNVSAEATLVLKGVTLRAHDQARDLKHAINLCEEELSRQVKRHREKRRGRRKGGAAESIRTAGAPDLEGGTQPAV